MLSLSGVTRVRAFIQRLTFRLSGKRLIWFKYFKVYCDNGGPIFRWFPRVRIPGWSPHWRMWCMAIYWLGREFNISIGSDKFFQMCESSRKR